MSKKSYSFEKTDVRGQKIKNITANKLIQVGKLAAEAAKPQTYVDLRTGKKFTSTENDLMSMHA